MQSLVLSWTAPVYMAMLDLVSISLAIGGYSGVVVDICSLWFRIT